MKINNFVTLCIASVLFLSSCTIAKFTTVSTKNVDFKANNIMLKEQCRGAGMDITDAIDNACNSVPHGEYLMNAKITYVYYIFWGRYVAHGDVYGIAPH